MDVVFVEELEAGQEPLHIARTLEQAFAQIACRCGYSYKFEPADEQGWCLFLIDVERPERSPDPIHSTCIKPRDAQHDLMSQAVDGRLRGHVALHIAAYQRARVTRTAARFAGTCRRRGLMRHRGRSVNYGVRYPTPPHSTPGNSMANAEHHPVVVSEVPIEWRRCAPGTVMERGINRERLFEKGED